MIVCGIFRICLNVVFELCKIDLVNVSKLQCMYDVPVIYDLLTFGLVLCCNIASVLNLVRKSTPSKAEDSVNFEVFRMDKSFINMLCSFLL